VKGNSRLLPSLKGREIEEGEFQFIASLSIRDGMPRKDNEPFEGKV
jgi:hypothetical protein